MSVNVCYKSDTLSKGRADSSSDRACLHLCEGVTEDYFLTVYMLLQKYLSAPRLIYFCFVSIHLFSAKPITWGGHHILKVWGDDISVNFIVFLPCRQWTHPPLNSSFRGISPFFFYHLPFFSLSFQVGFSRPKQCQTWPIYCLLYGYDNLLIHLPVVTLCCWPRILPGDQA